MKNKINGLSRKYAEALRTYLKDGPGANLKAASMVGHRAVAAGMETLDLARIHDQAEANLEISRGKPGLVKRAQLFFTEAITPIIETHRPARESKITLNRLNEMLARCTRDLADSRRALKQGVIRRKTMEKAAKKSGMDYSLLFKESVELQNGLRRLVHQVLAAQEVERKRISHELQDEVAQTLLGINVRLLSMKKEARLNTHGMKNEIASTRKLVLKSAKSVQRVATKLGTS